MRRCQPRQTVLLLLLLLVCGVAACEPGAAPEGGEASTPTEAVASPSVVSAIPVERPALPDGFPVLPGARSEAVPDDDLSTIARWTSDEIGPVAYDYYIEALPAAGYPTMGLYPGGAVANIRFEVPGTAIWQLVLTRDGDGTGIEVRLDQP